ncbi:serine-repeat antigen [Plasmodium cynomolgi strain B]|uniref:Serine-repeat antigen n=2 Tax=Plasmodium cynomolgi TaxID=5827 RepID=K6UII9_PLACD|nr:serine-repeat antigen [Plasmodium cynomolgi strain B]BAK08406.1 putative papain-like cysteine prorease [Plasmodium cynomolgi]GAB65023.1 serine-repeat antigen [Plasmodium cynomolgi strain B]
MKSSFLLLLALGAAYGSNVAMCTTVPESSSGGSGGSQSTSSASGTVTENGGSSGAGLQSASSGNEQGVTQPTNPSPPVSQAPNSAESNPSQPVQTPDQHADVPPSQSSTTPTAQGIASASSSGNTNGQGGATQLQTSTKKAELQSALLKNFTGVKVTGPCDTEVGLFLIPHMYISVKAAKDIIELSTKFPNSDNTIIQFTKGGETLINKCEGNPEKTFMFIVYLEDNILTLKWIVYPQSEGENKNKADVRKYRLPNLERPITSIQVHSVMVQEDTVIYTSKDYSIKNDIPENCQQTMSACFLSGNTDIESCYTCNLLIHNNDTNDKCFDYVSADFKKEFLDIKVKGQDDEESSEYKLAQVINEVLNGIYKTDPEGNKELITSEELDENVKKHIGNYCQVLKEMDISGTMEVHQMGNEMDVFKNLVQLLQKHGEEKNSTLEWKLQNPALCLKNVNDWVVNKKGLVLPLLQNGGSDIYFGESNLVEGGQKSGLSTYQVGDDGIIDLSIEQKNSHTSSTPFTNHMFCNADYCDWTKDSSSCMAKIEAGDQGDCATSWLFASKVHLETIKCMKGYDHIASSALYVANCSSKEAKDKCQAPSNPLEFLNILEGTKFLPAESDLPYSYKEVNNVCPEPKSHWKNLWENVKLLDKQYQPNSVSTKGYIAYQSDHFKGNMDAFIKLVKSEVMNKGSVIAYVKADELMGYDLNGKKVLSLCGGETPDLAVNIIGYGNYIHGEGVKKSYWLLQNSWGKHWGDKGKFKVDMDGLPGCQHNFIHTAAVFNLDVPPFQSPAKDTELYSYQLKSSPDFYKNLYYNAVGEAKGSAPSQAVHGQDAPEETAVGGGENSVSTVQGQQPQPQVPSGVSTDTKAPEGADNTVSTSEISVGPSQQAQAPQSPGEGQVVSTQQQPGGSTPAPEPSAPQPAQQVDASTPVATVTPGGANPNGGAENAKMSHIIHVLKHIKQTKMVTRMVTYEGEYELGDHSCSRTQASTVEKLDECIRFCNENLYLCERTVSAGYCLTKLRNANDCIFCFV